VNGKWKVFIRVSLIVFSLSVIIIGMKNSMATINHEKNVMTDLRFVDTVANEEIAFSAWEASAEGMYYIVLPSAYESHDFDVEVTYEDKFYTVCIDGEEYPNGSMWKEELQEEVHQLKIVDKLGIVRMDKPLQILVSADVPSIMVTVEAKEALYSKEEFDNKQYVENGEIIILDEEGNLVLEDTMERFKVRGNLTSSMEKKPFTMTLSEAVSLFGMSSSANWHLLANATDGSHIRNQIMLDWAREIMESYQPQGRHVELYVNGEYQGLYYLTETIEVGEERVNIDLANSQLIEMELNYRAVEEANCVITQREHYWVVHEELPMLQSELEEVEAYLNDIESALYSEEGVSELSGRKLEDLLEFDSWTDTWLLKEISSDHDLGTTSQFAVVEDLKNRSKLLAGPEWDFDGTLGNGMVPWSVNPRNLVAAIPNTKGIGSVSQNRWLAQMYQHEGFKQMLIDKFQKEVQPKINRLLESEIDNYAQAIRRPALLDSVRWIGNGITNYFAWPKNYSLKDAQGYHKYDVLDCHLEMIKEFLREKERFLQELWVDGVEFEVIIEEHNEDGMSRELNNDIYTWIPKGN